MNEHATPPSPPDKGSQITLDAMRAEDWPQVRAIYCQGLDTGLASFETEPPEWAKWDAGHLSQCRLVARRGDAVLGWVALSPASARKCYAGVAELSIYLAESARGTGLGARLLRELIRQSEANGFWSLYASIFPENAASKNLLLRHGGFRIVGTRQKIARHHGGVARHPHVGTQERYNRNRLIFRTPNPFWQRVELYARLELLVRASPAWRTPKAIPTSRSAPGLPKSGAIAACYSHPIPYRLLTPARIMFFCPIGPSRSFQKPE